MKTTFVWRSVAWHGRANWAFSSVLNVEGGHATRQDALDAMEKQEALNNHHFGTYRFFLQEMYTPNSYNNQPRQTLG